LASSALDEWKIRKTMMLNPHSFGADQRAISSGIAPAPQDILFDHELFGAFATGHFDHAASICRIALAGTRQPSTTVTAKYRLDSCKMFGGTIDLRSTSFALSLH